MLKNADKKFEKLGFEKFIEDDIKVLYRRKRHCNGKFHYIELGFRPSTKKYLIFSYQAEKGYSKCVPLTMQESKLCLKKMKEKGWKQVGGREDLK